MSEDVASEEDSRSRLSPILEVEEKKASKKSAPVEATMKTESIASKTESIASKTESIASKPPLGVTTKDIEKPSNEESATTDAKHAAMGAAGDAITFSEKDSIEQLAEVDVCDDRGLLTVDNGLEKDVAMALLQMHNDQVLIPEVVKVEEPPRYTMTAEHNYFATPKSAEAAGKKSRELETDNTDSASEGELNLIPCLPPCIMADHNYCRPFYPVEEAGAPTTKKRVRKRTVSNNVLVTSDNEVPVPTFAGSDVPEAMEFVEVKATKTPRKKPAKSRARKLADVTNLGSRELENLLPVVVEKPNYTPRQMQQEMAITYKFLFKGIDEEDVEYLKQRYEVLLQDDSMQAYWLHDTHWVEHAHTLIPNPPPPKKKRRHANDVVYSNHATGRVQSWSSQG